MIEIQAQPKQIEILKPTELVLAFSNVSDFNYSSLNISLDIPACLILQSGKAKIQYATIHKNETRQHAITVVGTKIGLCSLGFRNFYYRDNFGKVKHPKIPPVEFVVFQAVAQNEPDSSHLESTISEEKTVEVNVNDQKWLKKTLTSYYNLAEMRELCFDLNIQFENIKAETKRVTVLNLIEYCYRHNKNSELINLIKQERPHTQKRPQD